MALLAYLIPGYIAQLAFYGALHDAWNILWNSRRDFVAIRKIQDLGVTWRRAVAFVCTLHLGLRNYTLTKFCAKQFCKTEILESVRRSVQDIMLDSHHNSGVPFPCPVRQRSLPFDQ